MNNLIEALIVERTYLHPRDLVFRAWTEPVRLERWFCPNPDNKVDAEVDLRVGGKYCIKMITPAGDAWVVEGEYREVVRPEKLVFTWKWASEPNAEPDLVTVQFLEVEGGTRVVLTHDRLDSEKSRENHGIGWNASMDRLVGYLVNPMETLMLPSPDLLTAAVEIRQAKNLAELALQRLARTFSYVPDDKLNWTPSETSKTPLRVLVHAALSNDYFAAVLRGDELPYQSAEEVVAMIKVKENEIQTRDQALGLLETTTRQTLEAFDKLDPARLTIDPKVAFILLLVGRHADGHASQIDYLQTTWGDLEDHFVM
ncbi:MAG: SRPBCC domain-containing protein [Chlorobia bacterium]|nr:SRPBCC domain-containing protein [Fimbriimonadaceae bacterium]